MSLALGNDAPTRLVKSWFPHDVAWGPQRRAGEVKPQRRWPTIITAAASALVLVITVAGFAYTTTLNNLQGNITSVDVAEQLGSDTSTAAPIVNEEGNYSAMNILLMGSDTRQGKQNRGYGHADELGGQRSDTTILLHVAADRKSAIAVSIPRDTWITLPQCKNGGKTVGGYEGKFNAAIEIAGPACTLKAARELSGLDIKNFMVVDFGGFKNIVDAIGGVEICLTEAVNDPMSGLKLPAGESTVTGEDALAFVRARKTLGDGSDISRIRRQQAFLSSLIRKVSSNQLLLNPVGLLDVLNAATESLTADSQLADLNNLRDFALSMKELKPSDITFVTLPWLPRGDNENVLVNESKANAIFDAMKNDTSWPPKKDADQPLLKTAPENIKVKVLNGTTTPGLARKVSDALKAEGYTVVAVGNADSTDYTESVVEYDPNWDQSAKTLTYAVEGATSEQATGGKDTLTLIVGSNYSTIKPVSISKAAADQTAKLNTADETYCAS